MIVRRIRSSRWAVGAPVRPREILEAQGRAESTLGKVKQEKAEDLGTAAERKLHDVRDDDP